MKAFIFNSGSGSRMGDLTKFNPKALVELSNGETILGRQIRLLKNAGIKEIIISTGPFEDQIKDLANNYRGISFQFINNSIYNETNSIYSLYLAKHLIDDDIVMLHGDLVFDSFILEKLIYDERDNVCLINTVAIQPDKDFKGRIINNHLREISVHIFDDNCYALQPLYKFSQKLMNNWFIEIQRFIDDGNVKVYAENALNQILETNNVSFLDYKDNYVEEIDNVEDLIRVSNEFRLYDYKNQTIAYSNDYTNEIELYIEKKQIKNPLLVHGKHLLKNNHFRGYIEKKDFITFTEYSPNPTYDEVMNGLKEFKDNNCDSIITIGGGSCIDTAKAIKLYSVFDSDYINQKPQYVDLPFMAIPTTAGTGTESTRYSVIYYKGEKQSLANDSLLPDSVVLNEEFLFEIPGYHKKSALLDAFCQSIESYWSINSNHQSKQYSEEAIRLILGNYRQYLLSNKSTYKDILRASNLAGKAINITQTTAPHAMSYKLTTLKGIAHGHSVSILLPEVLAFMIQNTKLTQDNRGIKYVELMFKSLCEIFNVQSSEELVTSITEIINYFKLETPLLNNDEIDLLAKSVNPVRLKNNPVYISEEASRYIYSRALNAQK